MALGKRIEQPEELVAEEWKKYARELEKRLYVIGELLHTVKLDLSHQRGGLYFMVAWAFAKPEIVEGIKQCKDEGSVRSFMHTYRKAWEIVDEMNS
jgi:UDP-2,3-diacylglucosamine pyrophosphatase LpxH